MRFFRGYIAYNIIQSKASFQGKPRNVKQLYEMTVAKAESMLPKMLNMPLVTNHDDDDGSAIGRVVNSYLTPDKRSWVVELEVDDSSAAGYNVCQMIDAGYFRDLSLKHHWEANDPKHVSLTWKAALDGSKVFEEIVKEEKEDEASYEARANTNKANYIDDIDDSVSLPDSVCASAESLQELEVQLDPQIMNLIPKANTTSLPRSTQPINSNSNSTPQNTLNSQQPQQSQQPPQTQQSQQQQQPPQSQTQTDAPNNMQVEENAPPPAAAPSDGFDDPQALTRLGLENLMKHSIPKKEQTLAIIDTMSALQEQVEQLEKKNQELLKKDIEYKSNFHNVAMEFFQNFLPNHQIPKNFEQNFAKSLESGKMDEAFDLFREPFVAASNYAMQQIQQLTEAAQNQQHHHQQEIQEPAPEPALDLAWEKRKEVVNILFGKKGKAATTTTPSIMKQARYNNNPNDMMVSASYGNRSRTQLGTNAPYHYPTPVEETTNVIRNTAGWVMNNMNPRLRNAFTLHANADTGVPVTLADVAPPDDVYDKRRRA